jgi:hypothetical protein
MAEDTAGTASPAQKFPPLVAVNGKVLFEPINQQQYDYATANEPNVLLIGDRGGGKSVTARWTCHARALTYPGYRYAILRTSFPELIKNHLIYLGAEMKSIRGDDKGWNASKYIATYPNGSMGFYMQAETEEQVRNALGIEMMEVVFDEAPTFKWEHMIMIASSVRVPKDRGLTPLKRYLGNPLGPSIDDIYKYFIDKDVDLEEDPEYRPDEWRTIWISHKDNTKLDVAAYRKQLGVGLPEHIRRAWLEGERYDAKALFEVKPVIEIERPDPVANVMVKVKQPYHIIEELPTALDDKGNKVSVLELPWVRFQGCYDDGYVDPAVMLWAVIVGQQIIVFNERMWTRTNSLDIARGILEANVILREDGRPYQLPLGTVYADPVIAKETTAVQSTQEVMQSVWRCPEHGPGDKKRCCAKARGLSFEPSTNSRELFASAINRLLQAEIAPGVPKVQFLKVNPATEAGHDLISRGIVGCPYLIKSLPKMTFDENDPRKMADHKHDHPVVAFAYLAMSYPTQTAPRVEAARPSWWNDYFVGNSNIPRRDVVNRRRGR